MADIVKAKYYNTSKVVAQREAERNRKINRRKPARDRRRLWSLNQEEQSDLRLERVLLYVR